jgi:hypothetical protein
MKERTQSKDRKWDIPKKTMNLIGRSTKVVKVEPLQKGRLVFRSCKIIGCPFTGMGIEKLMVFLMVKAFHMFFLGGGGSHIFFTASKNPAFGFCVVPAETSPHTYTIFRYMSSHINLLLL